ncbi:amino acid adenylation domain-containing protein [Streptomyces sp. CRPSP2-6A1]|nr:amino acid adenylation domain-containing protein [Streptomyces sp. CRPSP2-6A1]
MTDAPSTSLPLLAAQLGVWVAQQLEPESLVFHVSQFADIAGPVDADVFECALGRVLVETEALRVRIVERGGEVRQELVSGSDWSLTRVDVSGLADPEGGARAWMREEMRRPFDLAGGGRLFTWALLKLSEERFFWYQRCHHIVLDGYSCSLVARRVAEVYTALVRGVPCPEASFRSLGRLVEQDRDYRDSPQHERDRDHWSRQVEAGAEPLLLSGRSAPPADLPLQQSAYLDKESVNAVCAAAGLGPAGWTGAVLALSGAYFARLAGRDTVTVELPVTSRVTAVHRSTPGMLSNILPLSVPVPSGATITDVLTDVSASVRHLLLRQRYRQEDLHAGLGHAGGQYAFGPMVNILSFDHRLDFAGHPASAHPLTNGPVPDLALTIAPDTNPGRLRVDLHANPALYTHDDLTNHLTRLHHFINTLAADTEQPICRVELMDPAERAQVLEGWNDTARDIPHGTLPVLFEQQVARTPDAVAVVFEGVELSYREVNERANRLARLLLEQGAGPERFVAVALPRSADLVVALLAVLKTGAAYVPIDPDYPTDRITHILDDAGPMAVITVEDSGVEPPADISRILLDDPTTRQALQAQPSDDLTDAERRTTLHADAPAYVIYTSGSTGRPKGVVVEHRGIVNRLLWMQDRFGLAADDRVLQKTPSGFDVSVWEFFWPLLVGAGLVVARPGGHRDPAYVAEVIAEQRVTTVHFVPSMLQVFLQEPAAAGCEGLRRVVCSGEALPPEVVERFRQVLDVPLFNLYGPTEASVDVSWWECQGPLGATVPIGRPVWNTQLYVLDAGLAPAPVGVAGELYIAGTQLARGYHHRPDLTAERFVANPYGAPGSRMYRTGDLVRWNTAGEIEYLGRVDDQVKIRGFRIELGEIESVLAAHPDIAQAAVIVREDRPGDKRIVGYVVPAPGAVPDPQALRADAAKSLPDYMVPSTVMVLDVLPLTPNGKLDRRELPTPEFTASASGRAPRTPHEEILCQVFAEVLGVDGVGIDDNFFELGGDSILAIQVVRRAGQAGLGITPKDLFQLRNVRDLAPVATVVTDAAAEDVDAGIGEVPATPMMRWLFERGGPVGRFHQAMAVHTPAGLTLDDLRAALRSVVAHHDMLRTRVVRSAPDAVPALEVRGRAAVDVDERISRIDVRGLSDDEVHALTRAELDASARRLDPEAGVVFDVTWCDAGPSARGRLLWVVHHLAVDGVSWRILLADLAAAAQAAASGTAPSLSRRGMSYRTWATRNQELAQEALVDLSLWTSALKAEEQSLGSRALDPARDTVSTLRDITLSLPEATTADLLTTVPTAFHATVQDALLAGLTLAVSDWRRRRGLGQGTAVLVDVEGHGRDSLPAPADLSSTVGWFTSLYPMLLDAGEVDWSDVWAGGADLGRSLKWIKEQVREYSEKGSGFGRLRYLRPETEAELAALPAPQIGFNYLGRFDVSSGTGDDWTAVPEFGLVGGGDPGMGAAHAIEVDAVTENRADGARLTVKWTWPNALFTDAEVRDLAETWFRVLGALAAHGQRPDAGGHTPSDLSLVELSQSEIDDFEDELGSEWGTW